METFYGYQLTLSFYKKGVPVKDYTDKKKPVDFRKKFSNYLNTELVYTKKDDTKATSFGNMNLYSLSYRKQLYSPNRIDVSIECSTAQMDSMLDLADLFKEARVKLDVVKFTETEDNQGTKSRSIDDKSAKNIAENYEVYESSPRYDGPQNKLYIDLVMYSPDKVLDTFEYSKAYTNKRLGLDIFKKEAAAISSTLGLECKFMRILRLPDGEEFVQPYLVQYNESFYSFLSRVANRCGEFLYYNDEKHKLNLGIAISECENPNYQNEEWEYVDSDFDKISFTDFNTSHNRETDSEDFYSNYMVKGAKSPSKSFVRSSELSGDEYFETVVKDEFCSTLEEWKYIGYSTYHTVGTVFTNTMGAGLFLACVNMGKEPLWDLKNKVKAVNKHFNEKFFGNGNETTKRLFGSADALTSVSKTNVNVNSNFYPLVRNKEMACNRGQVSLRINTDISKNVMLGDRIKIFGKEYVVVKVTASFDVVVNKDGSTAVRQPVDVIAIPVVDSPMPTYSVEPVRKVGCQKAFVTDVDDPSFLGRVRVRFSWQKNTDDSSPWIRVCTQMANSKGGAAFFKAAVGDSVLIDFENGNADMPYVSGFLPTMAQQKNKGQYLSRHNSVVVSSEHGQMMLMSDPTSGTDFIGAGGIPIMRKVLSFLPSDNPIKTRFLGSTEFTDYYGIYSVKMSSSDRSVTINSPFGKVAMNAFTGISINAPNGDISIAGKNITLTAGNNITIESGVNAKPGSKRYYSDLILGAVSDLVVDTLVPMVVDLSYLRKVIEIFIKPCEGTLSLKSGRYLLMQAGGAEPKVPFTGFVIPQKGMVNFDPDRDKVAQLLNALNFIEGAVKTAAYCSSEMNKALKDTNETWKKNFFFVSVNNNNEPIINEEDITIDMLKNDVNGENVPELYEYKVGQSFIFSADYAIYLRNSNKKSNGLAQTLAKKANNMVKKLRGVRFSTGFKVAVEDGKLVISQSAADLKPFVDKLLEHANLGIYKDKIEEGLKDVLKNENLAAFDIKKRRRELAQKVLNVALDQKITGMVFPNDITDLMNDKQWETYVNEMFPGEHHGFGNQVGASAFNALKTTVDKLNPIQQLTGKWAKGGRKWSAERRGQILMSDTEGTTMYFNNGTLKSYGNSTLYAVRSYCKKFL